MNKTNLPPRARYCLAFIKSFTKQNGYPPSVREIRDAMGLKSVNGAVCHLKWLEKNGWIARTGKTARSIVVLP